MEYRTTSLLRRQLPVRFPAGQRKIVLRTELDRKLAEFLDLVFPLEKHDETAWGRRLHIPFQLGLGLVAVATRVRHG